jgi:hypothetical protein
LVTNLTPAKYDIYEILRGSNLFNINPPQADLRLDRL